MLVSDTLSEAYIKNSKPEFDENSLIYDVHFVILNLPISNKRLEQFKEETRKDPILQTPIKYTVEGWPEKTLFSHELYSYFSHRSDITYHEGLLLIGRRIIVPCVLRSEMKLIIHQGHLGIENCKKRARLYAQFIQHIEIVNQVKHILNPNYLTTHGRNVLPIFYVYKATIVCLLLIAIQSLLL